jgi:hypothetical protein
MFPRRNETLVEIGKKLRARDEDLTHEPLGRLDPLP